jgi:hypothetical protein
MFLKLIRLLLVGAILLTVGCNRPPSLFTKELSPLCPTGWQVSASNNTIVLRREAAVWVMGYIARPAVPPWESKADLFHDYGHKIRYEVWLEFVPLLSRPEFEKLKAARGRASARFKTGASGKEEYDRWMMQYYECRVPVFFTKDYSIFVDRWADRGEVTGYPIDPRFVEIYPLEAGAEIEALIKSLAKLFKEYGK